MYLSNPRVDKLFIYLILEYTYYLFISFISSQSTHIIYLSHPRVHKLFIYLSLEYTYYLFISAQSTHIIYLSNIKYTFLLKPLKFNNAVLQAYKNNDFNSLIRPGFYNCFGIINLKLKYLYLIREIISFYLPEDPIPLYPTDLENCYFLNLSVLVHQCSPGNI